MNKRRHIRKEESELIYFLCKKAGIAPSALEDFEVEEYEGGIMGSIGLGHPEAVYKKDLIQVDYLDEDQIPVVITLTLDTEGQLLDLDFWKTDFSKLLNYPTPEKIKFRE